jgi:hypothetical protein
MWLVSILSPSFAFVENNCEFFVEKNVNCEKCEMEARRERISFFRQFPGRDAASPKAGSRFTVPLLRRPIGWGTDPAKE